MTRARVVDTSVLLAAASAGDVHHEKAMALLSDPGPTVIPNEVLVEAMGRTAKLRDRKAAALLLEELRGAEGIELGHESDLLAAFSIKDLHPSLSIVDAVGIEMAWRLRCDLDTFDEAQKTAWRKGQGAARGRPAS